MSSSPFGTNKCFEVTRPLHLLRQREDVRAYDLQRRQQWIAESIKSGSLECSSNTDRTIAAKFLLAEARRHQRHTAKETLLYDISDKKVATTLLADVDILMADSLVDHLQRRRPKHPVKVDEDGQRHGNMATLPPCAPAVDGYHYVKSEIAKLRLW